MQKAIGLSAKGDRVALKLRLERIVQRPDKPSAKRSKADDLVAAYAAVIDSASPEQAYAAGVREFTAGRYV